MIEEKADIFQENELRANSYSATSSMAAAILAVIMWGLNLAGFFIVNQQTMNYSMPFGIFFLVLPTILVRCLHCKGGWVKYVVLLCFLTGVTVLAMALTTQLILAWTCPILISCHYYSPRLTRFTLWGVIVFMFIAVYSGLFLGVWDANMMRSSVQVDGIPQRTAYILDLVASGDDLFQRVFNFYYFPRAAICVIIYFIGRTLSQRTHGLLAQQQKNQEERQRIDTELSVATNIQAAMLPNVFPKHDQFDLYATMTPSKEVGGDFYDFFPVDDDHMALVIADVAGKGVPAALFMMVVKTLLKSRITGTKTPAEVLEEANEELCDGDKSDMFVTVWLGIYEISTGKLIAASAGHEFPFLRQGSEGYQMFRDPHGFVLGGMAGMPYKNYELQLMPGEALYVYTDGVAEASDPQNNQFGLERMTQSLNAHSDQNLVEFLADIKADVDAFAGDAPQFDDITMLALRRKTVQ